MHIHVRDPVTGAAAGHTHLYREVVDRIRASGVDVIINLTGGYGGRYVPSAGNVRIADDSLSMQSLLPPGSTWSAFGIGRQQFPIVAEAVRRGGHVRVGLEDNLYLDAGVPAPDNAALVRKALTIVEGEGARAASSAEARQILGLAALA